MPGKKRPPHIIYRGVHEALHTAMIADEVTIIGFPRGLLFRKVNSVRRII
jgi:hypothetical protein